MDAPSPRVKNAAGKNAAGDDCKSNTAVTSLEWPSLPSGPLT